MSGEAFAEGVLSNEGKLSKLMGTVLGDSPVVKS